MSNANTSEEISYFIDESGDTTLFGRRGTIIVGTDTSKFFMLGKIRVDDPLKLRTEMNQLRKDLLADPYFRDVPSMQPAAGKTALLFHAKDDVQEVRREVLKLLLQHDIKFYAVVRNKFDLATFDQQRTEQDSSYRFSELELYLSLTRELFARLRQFADTVNCVFASRGNVTRNAALRQSLKEADQEFELKFGFMRKHTMNVEAKGSREDPCLQACDYFLWALQRHFEKDQSGYIEMLWQKVGEVVDLDSLHNGRRGTIYGPRNLLFVKPSDESA